MLYEDLTAKIIEASFEVSNELGIGFIESVYQNALIIALRQKELQVESQVPLKVNFRGAIVGEFYADLLVESTVIVELKAVSNFANEHFAQLLNYLKTTGIEVGLIINFGTPKIQYRRFNNRFSEGHSIIDFLKN